VRSPNSVEMVPVRSNPPANLINNVRKPQVSEGKCSARQKGLTVPPPFHSRKESRSPILTTKVNGGIPVHTCRVGQTIPKGNECSLVRSLSTKNEQEKEEFVYLFFVRFCPDSSSSSSSSSSSPPPPPPPLFLFSFLFFFFFFAIIRSRKEE